jgi:hypothetical protein
MADSKTSRDQVKTTLFGLLSANGLPEAETALVEPHKNQKGVWGLRFTYEASEPLLMDVKQAIKLASDLREMNEEDRAHEIDDAVRRATRFALM